MTNSQHCHAYNLVDESRHIPSKFNADDREHSGNGKDVEKPLEMKTWLGFCLSGLLNNSIFVIMIAGAKNIAASMVGVVFVCSVFPSMCVKISGPYWLHYLSYRARIIIVCTGMAIACTFAALGEMELGLYVELIGICVGSAVSALGEASFLSLASFYPSRQALSAFSTGTGLAGIFGYAWVIIFTLFFDVSFAVTALTANILPICFWLVFIYLLGNPQLAREQPDVDVTKIIGTGTVGQIDAVRQISTDSTQRVSTSLVPPAFGSLSETINGSAAHDLIKDKDTVQMEATTLVMTNKERLYNTLKLWPYMIPLFVVFYSEYVIQSGVWAAMGKANLLLE